MERASTSDLHPALLPPGTVVGPWRVVAWAGRGVYGAVYRAVPVQNEHASPVALKLALHPGDPRFAREGELLSRALHPSIPRLLDAGEWLHPCGTLHPYIAMAYSASPADDIYALGVTAYRLVTGEYPELAEPFKDEDGLWQLGEAAPISPLVLNPRVQPRLSALILRMLSVPPEQRGTTAEWTQTLEQAAQHFVPRGAQPIFAREAPPHAVEVPQEAAARSDKERVPEEPSRTRGRAERPEPPAQVRQRRSRLPLATVGLALITWAWWVAPSVSEETPAVVQREAAEVGPADAGTAGLGEAATTTSLTASPEPDGPQGLAEETLPEPVPGQVQPNAKGRCPQKEQVALNKGCWVEMPLDRERCEALARNGHMSQMFKNKCYVPAFTSGNQPTSSPANKP